MIEQSLSPSTLQIIKTINDVARQKAFTVSFNSAAQKTINAGGWVLKFNSMMYIMCVSRFLDDEYRARILTANWLPDFVVSEVDAETTRLCVQFSRIEGLF